VDMDNECKRTYVEENDCSDFARRLEGDEIKGHYIMNDDGSLREVYSLFEWAHWFETAKRHIGDTKIGGVRISTVFLGIDHGFDSPPQLFETMVFGGPLDQEQVRYATFDEAREGHTKMVWRVRARGRAVE